MIAEHDFSHLRNVPLDLRPSQSHSAPGLAILPCTNNSKALQSSSKPLPAICHRKPSQDYCRIREFKSTSLYLDPIKLETGVSG